MHKFMDPASVALIGTPRRTGPGAYNNAEMMLRYGFKGRIYPVNPSGGEILGLQVYPAVADVPEKVDLAVISVGRDRVLAAFEECIRAGIGRAIIISQGFADADERGRESPGRNRPTGPRGGGPRDGPQHARCRQQLQPFQHGLRRNPLPEEIPARLPYRPDGLHPGGLAQPRLARHREGHRRGQLLRRRHRRRP